MAPHRLRPHRHRRAPAHADAAPAGSAKVTWTRSCAVPRHKDEMACDALRVTGGRTAFQQQHGVSPKTPAAADATAPSDYGPADLQDAYGLTSAAASNGSGRTIAVVDAYDDPNAESDLATHRSHYGLPACTTANGCFKKVSQTGSTTSLPTADSSWAGEISLDLDMASAPGTSPTATAAASRAPSTRRPPGT